nr:MAG TPA: hypothetical protein [Caudoviricetes sp.]
MSQFTTPFSKPLPRIRVPVCHHKRASRFVIPFAASPAAR